MLIELSKCNRLYIGTKRPGHKITRPGHKSALCRSIIHYKNYSVSVCAFAYVSDALDITITHLFAQNVRLKVLTMARVLLQRSKFLTKTTRLNNVPPPGAVSISDPAADHISLYRSFALWAYKVVASSIYRLLHHAHTQPCLPPGYSSQWYLMLGVLPWIVANLHQHCCSKASTSSTRSIFCLVC